MAHAGIFKDGSCVGEAQRIGVGDGTLGTGDATPQEGCSGYISGPGTSGPGGGGDGGGGGGYDRFVPPTPVGGAGWGTDDGYPVYLGSGTNATPAGFGDIFGDGHDFAGWNAIAPVSDDALGAYHDVVNACPMCAIPVLIGIAVKAEPEVEELAENPVVEQEAAAIGENVLGFAQRIIAAAQRLGVRSQAQVHHIATYSNTVQGQRWTMRLKPLFDKFGMDIKTAPENLVSVVGHVGPHPDEYHEAILASLRDAAAQGKDAFVAELQYLSVQCSTPGTYLNSLLQVGRTGAAAAGGGGGPPAPQ